MLELASEKERLERSVEEPPGSCSCVAGSGFQDSPAGRSWLMDAQRRANADVMNSAPSVATLSTMSEGCV